MPIQPPSLRAGRLTIVVALALVVCDGAVALNRVPPHNGSNAFAEESVATVDPYQRSGRIYQLNWFEGSDSSRGEEIYFFKCWLCHNRYTTQQDYPGRAPPLHDLFRRTVLMSGRPVNDDTVAETIRIGTPNMPGFKDDLTDKDLSELIRYLRENCCWDEDKPPANPAYMPLSR